MSSLLEKIAAKKAAEAAARAVVQEVATAYEEPPTTALVPVGETAQTVKNEEPTASVTEGKPLSFAEKMALKKASHTEATVATTPTATVKAVEVPLTPLADSTEPSPAPMPAELVIKVVAAVAEEDEQAENIAKASPADQQAYADIKAKLNLLADMSDENLKGAMTELKKALLQNPQACYLMLPQDIGQMVIALRTMKNEAVVDATKAPKEKKASKASKPLTADEIAAAFDEL